MDQEKLNALISSKKLEKCSIIRKPFRGCQQISAQNGTSSKASKCKLLKLYNHLSLLTTIQINQIFAGEDADGEKGLIRPANRAPSWGTPRNVSICVNQTDKQGLGPKDCGEGVSDHIKKIKIDQQGFLVEPIKSFCRAGLFDGESAASPKSDTVGDSSTDAKTDTKQEENQFRGLPDTDGRSSGAPIQESDRGSQISGSRTLQQPLCYIREEMGTQPSSRPEEIESECRNDELKNENAELIYKMVWRKDFMISFHLEDAFMHILIHKT
ncbi:hypothetical protein AYI70_g5127 [Smittium culicis]|uniref:Uncharacterized protein n=1 Tax=Smittium culicis TaxID=133412 RepID=A0A1R1XVY7_9FUNG|nr:hypothetical protein AYI70_g5127 [Smittium culicis]